MAYNKSRREKEITGTLKSTRDIQGINLEPLTSMPEPPSDFTKHEKEFFNRVAGALFQGGVLREVDVMQIEMTAMFWHVYKENRAEVCRQSVQTTDKGWKQISGSLTAVEKAAKVLQWLSDHYGLNLISKDKVQKPVKKDNPFKDLK